MKRWTIRIFVFLLLGAIVNVAVAWGLAVFDVLPDRASRGGLGGSPVNWVDQEWEAPGGYRLWCEWSTTGQLPYDGHVGFRPAELIRDWSPVPRDTPDRVLRSHSAKLVWERHVLDARGWPMLSLLSWQRLTEASRYVDVIGIEIGQMGSRLVAGQSGFLPTRPIWPGFAINTVFYAAVLWMLFAAPFALRKWRRIRRGLCPKCGYDLRGIPTAPVRPECGSSLHDRLRDAAT
jgi:hypothetical protein